jgi:hypothetical protein
MGGGGTQSPLIGRAVWDSQVQRSEEKGFFIIIGHLGETMWDCLVGMFTVLIDKTLLSCQRVEECDYINISALVQCSKHVQNVLGMSDVYCTVV